MLRRSKNKSSFLLNTWLVWALILSVAAIDAAGLKVQGMSLAPKPVMIGAITFIIPLAVAVIYTYLRAEPRIAAFAHIFAATWGFTIVSPILMYLAVTLSRPLIDSDLVTADSALGFHWLVVYQWFLRHPMIEELLAIAYATIVPQMIFLIFTLNLIGQIERCWEMLWLFMINTLICISCLAVWPASGAFGYFHVHYYDSYPHTFFELRSRRMEVIGAKPMEGLISFPSLHAALAIIYVYSVRGIRYLFLPLMVVNVLMFFSTTVIGGHHFVDLVAGGMMCVGVVLILRRSNLFSFRQENRFD
jgi:membrane-associated phospholipid phosphatase